MKIAIVGYGKMGKEIEEVALKRRHQITFKIATANNAEISKINRMNTDVAIEFTAPNAAIDNYKKLALANIPLVTGTTGWLNDIETIKNLIKKHNGAFLWGANFSVGMRIFFALNRKLASIMSNYMQYDAEINEVHHTGKKDKPSGTAIRLAEELIQNHDGYHSWQADSVGEGILNVLAERKDPVPGTHTISYNSAIDKITISHEAFNRKGFALGAVMSAEWLQNKKGFYSVGDVFNF